MKNLTLCFLDRDGVSLYCGLDEASLVYIEELTGEYIIGDLELDMLLLLGCKVDVIDITKERDLEIKAQKIARRIR